MLALVPGGVLAGGVEGGYAAGRVGASPMARADEELAVGPHERDGHRHLHAVGQHRAELLDRAEDVVPAARVERAAVVAQLMEDLVHLERRQDRLDQDGAADRPRWQVESVLGEREGSSPEPRFEVTLELRQVEVGTASPFEQLFGVVEDGEAEVEQACGYPPAVNGKR